MARKKRFNKLATFMIENKDWEKLHELAELEKTEVSQILRKLVSKEIQRRGL